MAARVKHVTRSQKDNVCGRCRKAIPKGSPYRWSKPGFRSRTKLVRCMDVNCYFRQSELTTGKMSDVYVCIETAQDDLVGCQTIGDVNTVFEQCAEGLRDVAGEYQEASDQWAGGNGHEEWQNSADLLEEAASTLEEWYTQYDEDDKMEPELVRSEAEECLSQLELP